VTHPGDALARGPESADLDDMPAQSPDGRRVSDRPALAPNVELVGELQGSGFADRQWLIQRDGRYIQVSELLYRIAEHADGKRDLETIAAAVTEASPWIVSAEQVWTLIASRLVPLGIISTASSPHPTRLGSAAAARPSSLLGFNLRVKTLSAGVIDPIAGALQVLFAPAILIPTILVLAVAHGWLYFVHGVGESISVVLSTPGLLYDPQGRAHKTRPGHESLSRVRHSLHPAH
jgi:hypothetical protein